MILVEPRNLPNASASPSASLAAALAATAAVAAFRAAGAITALALPETIKDPA